MSWRFQGYRHSLAARGIKTRRFDLGVKSRLIDKYLEKGQKHAGDPEYAHLMHDTKSDAINKQYADVGEEQPHLASEWRSSQDDKMVAFQKVNNYVLDNNLKRLRSELDSMTPEQAHRLEMLQRGVLKGERSVDERAGLRRDMRMLQQASDEQPYEFDSYLHDLESKAYQYRREQRTAFNENKKRRGEVMTEFGRKLKRTTRKRHDFGLFDQEDEVEVE